MAVPKSPCAIGLVEFVSDVAVGSPVVVFVSGAAVASALVVFVAGPVVSLVADVVADVSAVLPVVADVSAVLLVVEVVAARGVLVASGAAAADWALVCTVFVVVDVG